MCRVYLCFFLFANAAVNPEPRLRGDRVNGLLGITVSMQKARHNVLGARGRRCRPSVPGRRFVGFCVNIEFYERSRRSNPHTLTAQI
jgi:hypothetical protein